LKKVCYKVSLPLTVFTQRNFVADFCKAFIGLTNRAKMIGGGGDPFYLKF